MPIWFRIVIATGEENMNGSNARRSANAPQTPRRVTKPDRSRLPAVVPASSMSNARQAITGVNEFYIHRCQTHGLVHATLGIRA